MTEQLRPELVAEAKRGLTYLRRLQTLASGAEVALENVLRQQRTGQPVEPARSTRAQRGPSR